MVANLGDGSAAHGPVFEAMNFSAMQQFTKLWEDGSKAACQSSSSAITITVWEDRRRARRWPTAIWRSRMFAENQMNAERVNGWNPLAVIDAYRPQDPGY